MVNNKYKKGGVALLDLDDPSFATSCNKTNICNLQDLDYNNKFYAPANLNTKDEGRLTSDFSLNPDITGGNNNKNRKNNSKNNSKNNKKKGGDIFSTPDYYDTKSLNYQNSLQYTNFGNFDERGTNFSLSSDFIGGSNKTISNKQKKSLNKLFYELINNSYINYKNYNNKLHSTYSGGEFGEEILKTFNTTDLKFPDFNIPVVQPINYAPKSNFGY